MTTNEPQPLKWFRVTFSDQGVVQHRYLRATDETAARTGFYRKLGRKTVLGVGVITNDAAARVSLSDKV